MATTIVFYFIAFIFFVVCLIGLQRWVKLPQQKKDKTGLIVLVTFLSLLLLFILLVVFQPHVLSVERTITGAIVFVFLLIVFIAFFIKWYNDKYDKKINAGNVILVLSLSIFGIVFLFLKFGGSEEKDRIIKNVQLKTMVTNITFDTHKPYFKDMTFADGQYLPMPEAMNNTLQIGDSIYKIKGEPFYTVVNFKSKKITQYLVATHVRVLGKPQ